MHRRNEPLPAEIAELLRRVVRAERLDTSGEISKLRDLELALLVADRAQLRLDAALVVAAGRPAAVWYAAIAVAEQGLSGSLAGLMEALSAYAAAKKRDDVRVDVAREPAR